MLPVPVENALSALRDGVLKYHARAASLMGKLHVTKESAYLLGSYILIIGIMTWLVMQWMAFQSIELVTQWAPGLGPTNPVSNKPFVVYIIVVLSIVGGFALNLFLGHLNEWKRFAEKTVKKYKIALFITSFLLLLVSRSLLPMGYFALAATVFFIPLASDFLLGKGFKTEGKGLKSHGPLVIMLSLFLGLSFYVSAKAWYPVTLPNDYFEIPETAQISTSSTTQKTYTRSELAACMEAEDDKITKIRVAPDGISNGDVFGYVQRLLPAQPVEKEQIFAAVTQLKQLLGNSSARCEVDISPQELDRFRDYLSLTGKWQSQAGRILYHQSYILVPALHFLKHGILSPIPYVYGVGNTLFHAGMLKLTSPTITGYLNTYPIAQAVGILALAFLTLYVTRSYFAFLSAIAIALVFVFQITFGSVILAPGFSPLRGAGLVLQAASIFLLMRGTSWLRFGGMCAALIFSVFWNAEFACLGLIGQGLALLSPQLKWSNKRRFSSLFGMAIAFLASMFAVSLLQKGFLQNLQLGLFGAFPILSLERFFIFCAFMTAFISALAAMSFRFEGRERTARLCLLPVLALVTIKGLYYAWMVHFYYSFIIIAPMALCYAKWTPALKRGKAAQSPRKAEVIIAAAFVLLCLVKTASYYTGALEFKKKLIKPFVQNEWTELGESFRTTTVAEPIETRMKSVRAEIKPEDRVLFLSPFDHLMAIYANPKNYCGHFELVVNLVTDDLVQSTIDCVKESPNALVVYDEATDKTCPAYPQARFYDTVECGTKKILQLNARRILKALDQELVLVKKEGPLSFYRPAGFAKPEPE